MGMDENTLLTLLLLGGLVFIYYYLNNSLKKNKEKEEVRSVEKKESKQAVKNAIEHTQKEIGKTPIKKPQKPTFSEYDVCYQIKERLKKLKRDIDKDREKLKKRKKEMEKEDYYKQYGYLAYLQTYLNEVDTCVHFSCFKRGLEAIRKKVKDKEAYLREYERRGKKPSSYYKALGAVKAGKKLISLIEGMLNRYGVKI